MLKYTVCYTAVYCNSVSYKCTRFSASTTNEKMLVCRRSEKNLMRADGQIPRAKKDGKVCRGKTISPVRGLTARYTVNSLKRCRPRERNIDGKHDVAGTSSSSMKSSRLSPSSSQHSIVAINYHELGKSRLFFKSHVEEVSAPQRK